MRYIECRVYYVDSSRYVLDAMSIDNLNWFEDVSYTKTGLKQSGDIYHPEIGDVIICNLIEDGQVEFVKFYSQRKINSDGLVANVVGKPKIDSELPGDRIVSGPDGAILKLLRGGYAALGASPLAQTVYLAMEGMVRTIAQNYELISSGTRLYSINDGGNIITRLCFNSSEKFFSEGANKNDGAEAENFEYQVEFSSAGFNIMIGEIGEDGKRINNLIIQMQQNGDMRVICGQFMIFDMYSNGSFEISMLDKDSNLVYNKSVTSTASGRAFINELVMGDVTRYIDGNLNEEIGGNYNIKSDIISTSASVIDNSSTLTRNSAGMNIDETDKAPVSGMIIK